MATIVDVTGALGQRGIQVFETDESPTKVRLLGRLLANYGGQWQITLNQLLAAEEAAAWNGDFSKKYFIRGGKNFFAWRLIFTSPQLSKDYDHIVKVIQSAPQSTQTELSEFPLVGASSNRNSRTNVGISGSVPIGPAALHRKLSGG